jgi:hypothetical protein
MEGPDSSKVYSEKEDGYGNLFLSLREEKRLKMFENRVLGT